jgi:di/tricarboxylate transporter
MTPEAWITLAVLAGILIALVSEAATPDLVFLGGLVALLALGVFGDDPQAAFVGFSNTGTITVAALFVVAAGLEETGALEFVSRRLLGRPRTERGALLRMMLPVSAASAFLNNTTVVAMLLPVVRDWGRKIGIAPSRLLMPLAYGATFGGLCSLIGTSTNLVVYGLLREFAPDARIRFFDVSWIGVPAALAAVAYVTLASRWLLPVRRSLETTLEDPKQYAVEMVVMDQSPIVGQTIEEAGLRSLPGLYLAEIERHGRVHAAVGPDERIDAHDRLVFVGIVESIADLQKVRGLVPAPEQVFKLEAPRPERCLVEAVVSSASALVGVSVREGRFRTIYDAAIIAVYRGGERLRAKIGDIVLEAGDTLLLETHPEFVSRHRNSRAFFLVSQVANSAPLRHERAPMALAILAVLVLVMATEWVTPIVASLVGAAAMVASRCLSAERARRSIDGSTLLMIAASFGIGGAIESTGAAASIVAALGAFVGSDSPWVLLVVVYVVTNLATELMTNNAAAALLFPIAMSAAASAGASPVPFAIAIMVAASAAFATPIGYQTHLMVYGPGGYRFGDYTRFGLPLNLLYAAVALLLIPVVFPF